jgi:hypothetical protein
MEEIKTTLLMQSEFKKRKELEPILRQLEDLQILKWKNSSVFNAALLFGKQPQNIGYIKLAKKRGFGTYDFSKLLQKKVSV